MWRPREALGDQIAEVAAQLWTAPMRSCPVPEALRVPRRMPRSRITGPTTRAALRESGLSLRELRHPQVIRLSRDTYLPRADRGELTSRLAAVLLTAPPGAVISHLSAADVWGLQIPMRDRTDDRVHLTVPTSSKAANRVDRRLYRLAVGEDDVVRRGTLPVTSPTRTWRDLAGILQPPALLAATDQLIDGLVARRELAEALAARPAGRGSARARRVLPLADPRSESPMESVLRWLVHEAGLRAPELQFEVRDGQGHFLARADLAWPDRKVIVEFDGDLHRQRDVFVKDTRRQNRLVAAGWTVLRFTSADVLGRPDEVVAEIRRALGR
jgi:very-short-patch-repair endonuclease